MSVKMNLEQRNYDLNTHGMLCMMAQICEVAKQHSSGTVKVTPQVNGIVVTFTPRGKLRSAIFDPTQPESKIEKRDDHVILIFHTKPGGLDWSVSSVEHVTRELVYGNVIERHFAEEKLSDMMTQLINT